MSKNNIMGENVYILGSGFFVPLGIPVMKNFLEKAKDHLLNKFGDINE